VTNPTVAHHGAPRLGTATLLRRPVSCPLVGVDGAVGEDCGLCAGVRNLCTGQGTADGIEITAAHVQTVMSTEKWRRPQSLVISASTPKWSKRPIRTTSQEFTVGPLYNQFQPFRITAGISEPLFITVPYEDVRLRGQ
jgi:hypothetical protein